MGLFGHKQDTKKKSTEDEAAELEQRFIDENFREELRNHGRWYFEKIINENAALFKQDLDATVAKINTDAREKVSQQLDRQLAEYGKALKDAETAAVDSLNRSAQAIQAQQEQLGESLQKKVVEQEMELVKSLKEAQEGALQSLNRSAQALEEQQQQLSAAMQKNAADQEALLVNTLEGSKARIASMKEVQDLALQSLNRSAQALQEQQQQLSAAMQQNVANQQAVLIKVFEDNMAQVIEHYLLTTLGEQYDLKAQLPSIVQRMEANKQAMVDDMKL